MKYSQFIELNSILESQKLTLGYLYEADRTIEKEKGNILTKRGRMRKKMNKAAEKMQTQILDKMYAKFYQPVLDSKKKVLDQAVAMSKQKKTSQDIMTALKNSSTNIQKIQQKQSEMLSTSADKLIANYSQKIDVMLSDSNLSEKSKLELDNYWLLLSMQVKQNMFNHIIEQENKYQDDILGNDQNATAAVEEIKVNKTATQKFKEWASQITKKKEEIKKQSATVEKEKEPTQKTLEVGKTYNYKTKAGKDTTIEIVQTKKDGSYNVYMDGTNFNLPKDRVANVGNEVAPVEKKTVK